MKCVFVLFCFILRFPNYPVKREVCLRAAAEHGLSSLIESKSPYCWRGFRDYHFTLTGTETAQM